MTSPTGHQDLVNFSGWKYYMLMRVCCQHHCWKNMVLSIWIHWERVNRNKYFPYPEPYKSESEVALMCPTLCDPGPTRFFHPWDSPGKNTGVGCHFLRKGTFLTQGSNPRFLHLQQCRQILYCRATWEAFYIYIKEGHRRVRVREGGCDDGYRGWSDVGL